MWLCKSSPSGGQTCFRCSLPRAPPLPVTRGEEAMKRAVCRGGTDNRLTGMVVVWQSLGLLSGPLCQASGAHPPGGVDENKNGGTRHRIASYRALRRVTTHRSPKNQSNKKIPTFENLTGFQTNKIECADPHAPRDTPPVTLARIVWKYNSRGTHVHLMQRTRADFSPQLVQFSSFIWNQRLRRICARRWR